MPKANTYRHELRTLLVTCRKRLSTDDFPELKQCAGPRRRFRSGLTQEEVALVAGYSTRWYSNLERGVVDDPSPSVEFLETIAVTLAMNHDERRLLFLYSVGHEPPTQPGSRLQDVAVLPGWRAVIEALGASGIPAYISNGNWDIEVSNQAYAELFPHSFGADGRLLRGHANIMRHALLDPRTREQLVDWEEAWAIPLMSQLRFTLAKAGDSTEWAGTLRDLVRDIGRDRATAHIWYERLEPPPGYEGDTRGIMHPVLGPVRYQVITAAPHNMPRFRLVTFVPLNLSNRADNPDDLAFSVPSDGLSAVSAASQRGAAE